LSEWKSQLARISATIRANGELTEFELLNITDISPWTFKKLKKYLFQMFPDIKYNKKLDTYYIGIKLNSLDDMTLKEKEELK